MRKPWLWATVWNKGIELQRKDLQRVLVQEDTKNEQKICETPCRSETDQIPINSTNYPPVKEDINLFQMGNNQHPKKLHTTLGGYLVRRIKADAITKTGIT